MYKQTTKVINSLGVHARPASDLSLKAKEFEAVIMMQKLDRENSEKVNVKSVMKLLGASIKCGTTVEISAEGIDEQAAVTTLVKMFEAGFLEE